ncbi:putative 1-phosphatidylinositol-3-phosphate 5-kinase FAB1D isoform X3 [Syzygium oleosum]|uniref:putative 1-phosphatidylinositol-3-phosphate 5-kinase FAB1D isoform X3 n=1 Tax=Syzygium oleosum TaxID=219896 RepID=UPI0024B932E4|nr:putative 1-phosphatidylinositol-3-phosphate 5-kinase FAB1D isoform X3 [Syzygium oleosum]XP_056163421.1 putative 1-phosphatidylinositol-3-phosphate 5-kinase FAB1D isoform X3 [Syzygium oleosum]
MCTMCHVCGSELSKMKERDSTRRDVMSPYETPTISPTTSLSSCDSSVSSCSEFSVDLNPNYRSNQEEGTIPSSREDSSYRWEEHKDSMSEATSSGVGGSNMAMENNFKEFNRGHKQNSIDVENRQANHLQEVNYIGVENESRIVNGVTNNGNSRGFLDEIDWDPPEAEDPEDDMRGSMAYNDDDDDECGDGTKWGGSSSLSNNRDEGGGSYRFKEEKQKALDEVINGKFKALITQLLRSFGVAPSMEGGASWADIITSLSWEAASLLKPDAVDGKGVGPDGYVKIKCIATGTRSQSQVIRGLVFKKHAAHKHMPTNYKNPKLLLIQGMLGQSLSGLSSFNAMKQEDYLRPIVEMIGLCHPNVILVEKSVSRDIQESILAKGITLVFDMKLHRLERIARCTGSSIVSTDTMAIQKLKQCESFRIEKFVEEHAGFVEGGKKPSKTLMFLEGCPTRLGCTILLKGSHSDELKKIKSIVQCSVSVAYHLILETAFLVDQRAMFSTIPFAGIADSSQSDHSSPTSASNGIHDRSDGEATSNHSSCAVDVPISNGFHDGDSHHVKSELGGSSPFSYEPYNPVVFSGFSSLSASLKKVIGVNFPLASSYPSLSSYLGFTRKEPNGHVESPTSLSASSDAVAIKDCLDDAKSPDEGEDQSFLASSEVLPESVEDAHGNDPIENKSDMMTVIDTQSILVLVSRRNALNGNVCEQSHFSRITFYKNFDVPLGKFLRDKILNQRSQCTACGGLPEAHFYYYAHHNEQLTIQVKRLPNDKQLPGEGEGKLWMWSRCGKCKPFSGFNGSTRSTKRVLISTAARCLSFGKFLELSFSYHSSFARLASCGHSLQRDFLYFFGLGPVVAMFRYSPVTTYTISMPPQKLECNSSIRSEWFAKEIEKVYTKGMLLFAEVERTLKKIGPQFAGSVVHQIDLPKAFSDIKEMLKQESHDFELSIQNAVKNENPGQNAYKLLAVNRLLWELLLESFIWDRRLHYLLSADPPKAAAVSSGKAAQQPESNTDGAAGRGNEGTDLGANDFSVREVPIKEPLEVEREFSVKDIPIESPIREHEQDDLSEVITASEDLRGATADNLSSSISSDQNLLSRSDVLSYDHSSKAENQSSPDHSSVHRTIQNSMSLLKSGSFVSIRESQGLTSQSSLFSTCQSVNGWFWKPFTEIKEFYMNELLRGYSPRFDFVSSQTSEYLVTTHQLISEEGSRLHIPLANDNYILSDSEGELSSIIACALALLNDQPAMTDLVTDDSRSDSWVASKAAENMQNMIRVPSSTSYWSSNGSLDSDSVHSSRNTFSEESRLCSFDGLVLLDSLLPPENFKAEVSLGVTKSLVKGKYSVVCLYANEFRNLRSSCCLSEVDFIASLSRCRNWDAKGGKSKSIFAKTLDDRFIIKEIKKTEFDSFEKFAPHYFKYMKHSFESGNQTCLAKVLGIYQVTLRQSKSGKEARHDLMVMENLTFGRNITRQYDLKGALHARLNSATDGVGDVLLDQNFVNDMNSSPLYVSNKAKRLLLRAVWNDTSFLNSINVMDYSLLVVVDQQKQELVCGIIDYLRQYTWDKQLETWVKSSLYVPKNQSPTVISPKEYKKRFRKFMSAHFLCVPDNWCSQGSTDTCEICAISDDSSKSESQREGT